jgi:hypothetical protein
MSIARALNNTHATTQRTREAAGVVYLPEFPLPYSSKHKAIWPTRPAVLSRYVGGVEFSLNWLEVWGSKLIRNLGTYTPVFTASYLKENCNNSKKLKHSFSLYLGNRLTVTLLKGTAFFWAVMQRVAVIRNPTFRENLSLPSSRVNNPTEWGSIGCPETSVKNYHLIVE